MTNWFFLAGIYTILHINSYKFYTIRFWGLIWAYIYILYIYNHPEVDRISGISKKTVREKPIDRIPKWLKNPGRWLVKKTVPLKWSQKRSFSLWFGCLGLWNDHQMLSLCWCIRFWHANFSPKSSKEIVTVAGGSQKYRSFGNGIW